MMVDETAFFTGMLMLMVQWKYHIFFKINVDFSANTFHDKTVL